MKSKWLLLCVTIIALLTGLLPAAVPTRADGPDTPAGLGTGSDFRISSHAGSTCTNAAIAYNDDLNEYLVVWSDTRDGSTLDIYGQLVTSAGAPKGDNFVIRDHATDSMSAPDVAYDTINQRYLVVWQTLTATRIEGRLFNSDGSAYSSAFTIVAGGAGNLPKYPAVAFYPHAVNGTYLVIYQGGASPNYNIYSRLVGMTGVVGGEWPVCTAAGDQTDPDVAVDPATGHFLIVWEDARTATDEIYGCIQYASGALGTEFKVSPNTTSTNPRYNPAVAFDPSAGTAGEWLVVFERDVNGDSQISGRRVTAAGTNTGTDPLIICNDSGDQRYPDVAYNANANQYLVVWQDDRNGASNLDIYGWRVDAAGTPQGSVIPICTATGNQSYPAVAASDDSTGYLAVFQDAVSPPSIQGQRVSTAGALAGSRITVAAPAQKRPAMAYNSTNTEYLVVWHDYRNGANNADIYGQRVDLDGTLLGGNFVISDADGNQLNPTVVYNSANQKYLVVWEDHRTDSDIYGQRVNAAGTLDGANFAIADSGTDHRLDPRVVFNSIRTPDEYLVVYTYKYEIATSDIRGRRVPVSGLPTVAELLIATGVNDQTHPDVACRDIAGGGGYLVVWRETVGSQQDIKGQLLNADGEPLIVLNICNEGHDQWTPRVAYSPASDRYLVVWPDDRSGAANSNIYARQVGGGGTLYTEFALCTATGEQAHLTVGYSAALDHYIVAWSDARSSASPDIYAQRVSNTGVLVDANDPISASAGRQEYPAVAWAGTQKHGLIVWQDDRAGESNVRIYGRRLAPGYTVFLPLVLRS